MNDQEMVVGLDSHAKLYLNDTLVSSECNSFGFHSEFFAYTTVTHQLRFMSLDLSVQGLFLPIARYSALITSDNILILKEKRKYDSTLRDVEQGSSIVVITPKSSRTVLQVCLSRFYFQKFRCLVETWRRSTRLL